ncbi:MAG TPA: GatB/YqeY domain-containing protein [Devosia sp.]|nr:GatB/YqeY domain-containing protein [Devosia sp.]
MRARLDTEMKNALRARDKQRTGTLRLILAAIKDRDIEARSGGSEGIGEQEILSLLQKMVKQREESARVYAEAGRDELAEQERAEIAIIEEFLPQPMDEAAVTEAIKAAIAETGAESLRDMGKVVAVLKGRFPGQIDFGKAALTVKKLLGG